jgi:mono/diheme cytochrome c family protein
MKRSIRRRRSTSTITIKRACLLAAVLAAAIGLSSCTGKSERDEAESAPEAAAAGNSSMGLVLYEQKCAFCHYSDKEDSKLGPGLKGLFKNETLPHSGRPATDENVRKQLIEPEGTMPSFSSLSEKELAHLVAYLKTL